MRRLGRRDGQSIIEYLVISMVVIGLISAVIAPAIGCRAAALMINAINQIP